MKIRLLSVGKPSRRELAALHDDYARRIERFGVAYATEWVPDVRGGGRFSEEHAREREARALLGRLDKRGTVVALHATPTPTTAEGLARRFETWTRTELTLVVGGPTGLHRSVLDRADAHWSLSPLTFPHELVRVLVAEQVYRWLTLVRGVPYHK